MEGWLGYRDSLTAMPWGKGMLLAAGGVRTTDCCCSAQAVVAIKDEIVERARSVARRDVCFDQTCLVVGGCSLQLRSGLLEC